jgi:hypothetical protein
MRIVQPDNDLKEFLAGFRIGCDVDPAIAAQIGTIVQHHWDCFYEDGARNPI